mmetsp:Transcript_89290/g.257553  ORF Transcript_89290/g.257553 Transcript_89290/m.257553 type:complete len:202 (+) Transcript_89290:1077-1682(+)
MANFLAPANDDRKTTKAMRIAPGNNSLASPISWRPIGMEKLGNPDGIAPTTVIGLRPLPSADPGISPSRSFKEMVHTHITDIKNNSLKSAMYFSTLIFFNLLAFIRKVSEMALITTEAGLKVAKYFAWWSAMCTTPPLDAHAGNPIIGEICEKMISNALAVIKPLNAGRERNRTKKASLQAPINDRMIPTSKVNIAPTCVR